MSPYLIHDFFERHGIQEKDIPRAFAVYKILGLGVTGICYAICYRWRPLQRTIAHQPFSGWYTGLRRQFPNAFSKTEHFIESKTTIVSNWNAFRGVTRHFGLDSKRATMAIGETFFFDKMTTIISSPLQFWFVYHLFAKPSYQVQESKKNIMKTSVDVWRSGSGLRHHHRWLKAQNNK